MWNFGSSDGRSVYIKGHEDLRVDEHIRQFFTEAMRVIPLSVLHGLVQWMPGTDTLRTVIEQYRKLESEIYLKSTGDIRAWLTNISTF